MSEVPLDSRKTRGLNRAFDILELLRLHRTPMRANEIVKILAAPRSSIYDLVNVMLDSGVLEYWDDDGRLFLGRRLYFLGVAYAENMDLMREAERVLDTIATTTRETAQLCMLDGNKYTVALMKEGVRPFRISSNIGEAVPVPWTASGRLLVSHLSDHDIRKRIPPEDFILPDGSQLDPVEFIREVRQASEDGFFTFNSTVENFTHCFAVPVRRIDGECVATLCLVTPKEDGLAKHKFYLQTLVDAAEGLSGKLGFASRRNVSNVRTAVRKSATVAAG